MTEEKLCGVCEKKPASLTCDVCGIPLCDACSHEVVIERGGAGYRAGGEPITALRTALIKKKVCEKCLTETDFFE